MAKSKTKIPEGWTTEPLKLTSKFIGEKYDEYNKTYFKGMLRKPKRFKIFYHPGATAEVNTNMKNGKFGSGFVLGVSGRYYWDEELFRNVMLHEMIHVLEAQTQGNPKEMHSPWFVKTMWEMNEMYDVNITIGSTQAEWDRYARPNFRAGRKERIIKHIIWWLFCWYFYPDKWIRRYFWRKKCKRIFDEAESLEFAGGALLK